MRDLVLKMSISVDGFAGRVDGAAGWMFGNDQEARAWSAAMVGEAGLHIMGSETFRAMASHWPNSTDIFAGPMNRVPKTVFSARGSAILPAGTDSWANARVVGGDLAVEIAALKAQDGPPIMAHGGIRFARSLIAQGLVDRLALMVIPVALGAGLTPFSGLAAPMPLTVVSSKAFPGGAMAQVYRRA